MKIAIGYPSLDDPRGHHQTGQNRQAQVFAYPTFIYPVIPAYAATMLKNAGHEVYWADGPAMGMDWNTYLAYLVEIRPHLVAWEAKTPSIKGTWRRIQELKDCLPATKVVVMGDHVTALPQETLDNSLCDVVLLGGDYDYGLLKIVNNFDECLSERGICDPGTKNDITKLPLIDRNLTQWQRYAHRNGNFKYLPGTYTMIGRDCWWRHEGGCTFCSWTNTFKNWRCGTVDQFMAEIENCASLGIREVFDDTGTFPIGNWLANCCKELRKFNKGLRHGKAKVTVGCNMRPGALSRDQYADLGSAGFRFILYGLESASLETTLRINKGQDDGDMENTALWATQAGLEPHVTCMVGYPWETREQAQKTIDFTSSLFHRGIINTLQATIVIPYPGTELFRQAQENDWLQTEDWNKYDMRRPILKCPMSNEEVLEMTRGIYKSFMTPKYMFKKVINVRTKDDLKYLWRAGKHLWGHLTDFKGAHHAGSSSH